MTLGPAMTTSPSRPVASSAPVSSTIRICWPGKAIPTVPALRGPAMGLMVEAQVPSDNPYPSINGNPYRDLNRVSRSGGAGAAPQTANRTDDVSGVTWAGNAASIAKIVGTALKKVGRLY